MSHKTPKIAALMADCQGFTLDPHYLGFFHCFNQQLYFEAHEVLEELWLEDRHGADGDFYKGLIQLAGAFVHIQKARPGPAAALFRLAQKNLGKYPQAHQELHVGGVLQLIDTWLGRLAEGPLDQPALVQPPYLDVPRNRRS
jgi:predicted metal-dependent hydrolase